MMRGATILWAILAVIAGTALFLLKYEVQAQEERLRDLRKDIVETEEGIHVLKAEWSYLNEPMRLREQAERHLGLKPMQPKQIVSIASLPMATPQAAPPPMAAAPPTNTMPNTAPVAAPGPLPTAAPAPKPLNNPPPSIKPVHPMTAEKTVPTKPVAKPDRQAPATVAALRAPAKPAIDQPLTTAAAPAALSAKVMVITSPALMEPEMASTRTRP